MSGTTHRSFRGMPRRKSASRVVSFTGLKFGIHDGGKLIDAVGRRVQGLSIDKERWSSFNFGSASALNILEDELLHVWRLNVAHEFVRVESQVSGECQEL